ncbi:MAG: DUF378 domain-containing protein [Clostridia bacterium]|nr:DUF378 domain-containing protein [Clostridia bacterium]
MRITALLAFVFLILGGLDMLFTGALGFCASAFILGEGSVLQRLFFCLVGVSAIFFMGFIKTYKPFKRLCK